MFKKLASADTSSITLLFNGKPVKASSSDTVATALLAAGHLEFRRAARKAAPRGPVCLMGTCFECVVLIDGQSRMQSCLVPASEGLVVESISGGLDEY